ncbi:AbrB/MazE/SpoVT family DNA-binding domain-containing protein [Butyricicoccus faecihominis]|uniref:AbrB/MazE/SpoVT family DNA-binding domain-containing protein n=1 Tax=Butyricicoccaceae TaxID=3085642 RepID=UPI0024794A22|nr:MULTISPECIES: AbrB/MazE/SpoVT family DNA-binding domain-containing protein [Butyricicoccaceae]MCQ5131334.1 AbrB/MazE/SpoVT family DNA-binding domain-containing protein [Butyricicoccus faecihominis]WNX85569.1 AbrB/MazE/SpoVT family DNA-binding domain-containing protein [Agathobaculum sp. NTUH-O15-33]
MKSTGVVRKLDVLGRLVIPMKLRRTLDIQINSLLEIFVDGDLIILKKYEPGCVFCGNASNVILFDGKYICKHCKEELATL